MANCKDCWYECDRRNDTNMIYCFRKPRSSCIRCKQNSQCKYKRDGVLACPDFIPLYEMSEIEYIK